MPQSCTVCTHEECDAIDQALIRHARIPKLAAKYSLTRSSVQRHRQNHVRGFRPKRAHPAAALLLARLEAIYDRTMRILQTHGEDDPSLALRAILRLESQVKLYLRLDPAGALTRPAPSIDSVRHLIHSALAPYPEARAALIAALERVRPGAQHAEPQQARAAA